MKTLKLFLAATALLALAASPALAAEPGTWTLRAGVGTVQPQSNNLTFSDGVDTLRVDVDSATAMTLSATYMFTENWGFDILAATPFSHDINAAVVLGGPGPGPNISPFAKIAETKQLPPTFSIQYHFIPDGTFQPFVGLGMNWTTFFDTKVSSDLAAEGITDLKLDDSIGLAAQVGADWNISDNWLVNLDVRWVKIESDASLTMTVPAPAQVLDIGKVSVDPWVYAINLGYRF
jgi:outer membrane protein